MAKVPTKRMKYKQPDLCDYTGMSFNPFVQAKETVANLRNAEFDPAHGPHRIRIKKWEQREKDRAALAMRLGVVETVHLTPVDEILALIPK